MRALSFVCGVVCVWSAAAAVDAQSSGSPDGNQVASCPTILPVAAGERSIIVPTVAPQFAQHTANVPHIASRPSTTSSSKMRSLLNRKIAERDQLQREISELRATTKTPAQFLVRVQMLEVNLTKARQQGIDVERLADGQNDTLTAIQLQNVGRVLAEPTLVVSDGRPSSLHVGGEFPITAPDASRAEFRKYGTQLDLLAIALGNNRVRIEMRPRVSELDPARTVKIGENEVPGLNVRECDLAREMELGTTTVVSGLTQHRTESIVKGGQVQSLDQEITLLVLVTPDIVR